MNRTLSALLVVAPLAACGPSRDVPDTGRHDGGSVIPDALDWPTCTPGQQRCTGPVHQVCRNDGEFTSVENTDCRTTATTCVDQLWCVNCIPAQRGCTDDATQTTLCRADGTVADPVDTCNADNGEACRGGQCVVLCQDTSIANTNIGCEYYAVDLDNAVTGDGQSAASQQYALVVSNPDATLTARVRVERNTAPQGMPPHVEMVASAIIPPRDLEVFPLPAREVDCSAPGTFNTGTGTCLSSQAYHVVSTIPVIAYQFNPLDNVDVFSNDASLLIPTNSLQGDYLVMGRPQTIATTTNPATNFDADLRAFVTIVGTQANTHVRIVPTATVIPGGPVTAPLTTGTTLDVVLGPYDVLNLESGAFLGDFTGTHITTDNAVAVFSGSEASDSPAWMTLSDRQCCADHAEEQLFPRRTAAGDYVVAHMPARTQAVANAGAMVAVVDEPQWYRVLNAADQPVHVTTTLPSDPSDPTSDPTTFDLAPTQDITLRATTDFEIHGDGALIVSTTTGGQETTGIPNGLPGGDPSFIMIPPIRQWRQDYVFLTPDKYAFDFVTIVARPATAVTLDATPLPFSQCPMSRADACVDRVGQPACPAPDYVVYRCQLSFPVIDPHGAPGHNVSDGNQDDGVHIVTSDDPINGVLVIVSGFDSYVGYGYPAGTRLETVN